MHYSSIFLHIRAKLCIGDLEKIIFKRSLQAPRCAIQLDGVAHLLCQRVQYERLELEWHCQDHHAFQRASPARWKSAKKKRNASGDVCPLGFMIALIVALVIVGGSSGHFITTIWSHTEAEEKTDENYKSTPIGNYYQYVKPWYRVVRIPHIKLIHKMEQWWIEYPLHVQCENETAL